MSNSAPPGSPSKATPPPPSGTPAGSSPGGSGKGSPAPGNNNDKNSGANNKDNAKNNGDNSPTASNAGTSGGGGNNNNKNNGNNDGKNNTTPASPPPTKSPPQASPPPKNSKDGSNKTSPSPSPSPPSKSPPPSSPPPSSPTPSPPPKSPSSSPPPSSDSDQSSSSENSPPPLSQSEKSSPPSSSPPNQSSPPPNQSSDQPSGQSSPNTEIAPTGDPKWAPPPQAVSAPQPPGAPPVNPPPGGKATPHAVTPSGEHGSSPNSTSKTSPHTPQATNHPSGGTADSTTSSNGSDDGSTSSSDSLTQKTIIGATVAGVLLIAFIAIIFIVRRKKKQGRGRSGYPPHYISPPEKSGGQTGPGGAIDPFYGSQAQPKSPSENSHGSQRGHTLHAAGSQDSDPIGGSKSHFSYEELMEITNGFSRENIIGEGGFGTVYKGWLPDGRVVAVKQLKAGSGQGEREFRAEVEIISRVHHRHLVSLVGYCISEQHRSLIYEFVPNRTLEHHLHGKGMPVLDWSKRIKIALGAAKGLAYLHDDCHPKIIHRDIKSANILLDDVFEAQVADFGLAKLNDSTQTHVSTRVMGTFGYLAPEYANSGKLTDRSDVFSFGVVLLELITGRKPVDPTQPLGEESLVEWARPILVRALETGDISDVVDPRLEKHYVEGDVFRMIEAATACVRHSAPKRPRMVQVVRALDCEGDLSDLSNGVKYGQSTMYDSGQYNHDIMNFRRMALGCDDSSEFSGDYNSGSLAIPNSQTSSEFTSSESETRAMTRTKSPRGPHGPQF